MQDLAGAVARPSVADFISAEQMIADYRLAYLSRVASILGRKEVLGGSGKVRHLR